MFVFEPFEKIFCYISTYSRLSFLKFELHKEIHNKSNTIHILINRILFQDKKITYFSPAFNKNFKSFDDYKYVFMIKRVLHTNF